MKVVFAGKYALMLLRICPLAMMLVDFVHIANMLIAFIFVNDSSSCAHNFKVSHLIKHLVRIYVLLRQTRSCKQ